MPFHFYAPDVFQGTTASNAAMLSFVPKIVGFVALHAIDPAERGGTDGWQRWVPEFDAKLLLGVLAVATMFVGNLMALRQKHLFRLMAYSSIAHAGYMLVGLAVGDGAAGRRPRGDAVLPGRVRVDDDRRVRTVERRAGGEGRPLQTDADLRGLSRTQPMIALLLGVCLFSLTGLPPTAGFLGKLNLFLAAWSDESRISHGLAILMALNAAIGAYYYLRLVALMFLEPAVAGRRFEPVRVGWAPWLAGVRVRAGNDRDFRVAAMVVG